jgi:hypothetical protein
MTSAQGPWPATTTIACDVHARAQSGTATQANSLSGVANHDSITTTCEMNRWDETASDGIYADKPDNLKTVSTNVRLMLALCRRIKGTSWSHNLR